MLTLTQKQKLRDFLNLKEGLNSNPALAIFEILERAEKATETIISDRLKDLDSEFQETFGQLKRAILLEVEDVKKIKKGDRGLQGFQGEVGLQGVQGKEGIDGNDGIDGKEGKGLRGLIGKKGKDGSPDTPKQVIDKINSAKSKIDASRIKNLPSFGSQVSGGGGGGDVVTYSSEDGTITGTINGTNKVFTLSAPLKTPRVFADGLRMTKTFDYTIIGTTLTFVVAPEQIVTVDGQNA